MVPDGPFAAGFAARTTNQRMELTAALEAVGHFEGPLVVVSDSTYVVHCFRDGWWENWIRKGWVNARREPVANRDLWKRGTYRRCFPETLHPIRTGSGQGCPFNAATPTTWSMRHWVRRVGR